MERDNRWKIRFWKAVKWAVEEAKALVPPECGSLKDICTAEPEKGLEVEPLETMLCVCFIEAAFCRKDWGGNVGGELQGYWWYLTYAVLYWVPCNQGDKADK